MLRLLALAGLVMTVFGPSSALAQSATFFSVAYVEVGPILARVGLGALRAYRDAGRKDQGNVHLDVLQRINRTNQFVVIGAWNDQKSFEAHAASAHSQAMHEKLESMLVAPIDSRQHIAISSPASVAPAKSARDAIIVVTHVDVLPAQKDNGIVVLKQLAEDSRKHPGNLQFHVWQQANRPNHFTVVEAWSSRGAFNIHQMRKESRKFRADLAPMLGALYDERLYQNIK